MNKPYLIIVAGCNGSGKSTFSQTYTKNIIPFDFDKKFMNRYDAMFDSELREDIARRLTINEFETAILESFSEKKNFCYETNFDSNPIYWVEKAKQLGYHLELHFYCLNSLEIAKRRVFYRTNNKGHFVSDKTIEYKWKEGYKNLNLYFKLFDKILLVDNSIDGYQPKNICTLSKKKNDVYNIELFSEIPDYAKRRFPEIYNLLTN